MKRRTIHAVINCHGKRLWPLAPRHHQFSGLHRIRLRFHETENSARLAVIRRVFGICYCAFRRDVRISAHDISHFGMVREAGAWNRPLCSQLRAPSRGSFRLGRRSSLRAVPYPKLRLDRLRPHSACRCVEGALQSPARSRACDHWAICPYTSSAIRRIYPHYARVFVPVADAHHVSYVPGARVDVCALGAKRRTRIPSGIRRSMDGVRVAVTRIYPVAAAKRSINVNTYIMFHIDPVCGKKLHRKKEYAILKYGGGTYYFCCKTCKEEFERNPLKHIPDGVSETKGIMHGSRYN